MGAMKQQREPVGWHWKCSVLPMSLLLPNMLSQMARGIHLGAAKKHLRPQSPLLPEVVRLLSKGYQTTCVLHPPSGRVEGEERAFGEGRRDDRRLPSRSTLPARARLGSLRDPPKGRVNLSRTTSPGEGRVRDNKTAELFLCGSLPIDSDQGAWPWRSSYQGRDGTSPGPHGLPSRCCRTGSRRAQDCSLPECNPERASATPNTSSPFPRIGRSGCTPALLHA